MFRKQLKPLVFALVLVLALQMALFPAYARADESMIKAPAAVAKPLGAAPAVSLDEAIRIVKGKFEIPAEFTDFYSGYNNYNNRETWSLNWNSAQAPGGSFSAQVASDTGEIINMNLWEYTEPRQTVMPLPKITREEGRAIAAAIVEKLTGTKFAQLSPVQDVEEIVPLSYYGPIIYTYSWQRYVNGIPFLNNGVTVQIDSENSKVRSYNLNWAEAEFPDPAGTISQEQAEAAFEKIPMLELQYYRSPMVKPLASGEQQKLQLVYRLSNNDVHAASDGLNGEPLKILPNQWLPEGGMGGMGSAGTDYAKQAPLTPAEQKEVEDQSKLLTKEQAIEAVSKWVEIPDNLVLRGLNLGRNMPDQNRVWSLDWSAQPQDKADSAPQYMYARVDALTGELLSFNISYPYKPQEKQEGLDYDAGRKVAEDFLKKIQPDKFSQTQLADMPGDNIYREKFPQTQYYTYQRKVNGLLFPDNGFSVSVDTATKRIVSYNLNWSNVQFPDLNNLIGESKATQVFLEERPLILSYVQVIENGMPGSLHLVYQPDPKRSAGANMIEAKTGKLLDWQGQPLGQAPKAHKFSDIAGSPYAQEISLLGQAGIFGEYDTEFRPKENVTLASLMRALTGAQNGVWYDSNLKDEDVLKNAKAQGWLKEDLAAGSAVNRELLAKIMIRFLGLTRVAELEGVYQLPYADAAGLAPNAIGYMALTKGLGILQVTGSNLEPGKPVTREEAAVGIMRTLMNRR